MPLFLVKVLFLQKKSDFFQKIVGISKIKIFSETK